MAYKIVWTVESVNNLQQIIDDIHGKFSERQVEKFKSELSHLISLIEKNPYLFPASINKPKLRKAVLSKQTSLFYSIEGDTIYLTHIHLNKQNPDRIK